MSDLRFARELIASVSNNSVIQHKVEHRVLPKQHRPFSLKQSTKNADCLTLTIKQLKNPSETISVSVKKDEIVSTLKQKIITKNESCTLVFKGKPLLDNKTLLDYPNLVDGSIVHMIKKVKGKI